MMDLFQLFNMEEEVTEVQVEKKAATKKAAATKEAKKASKGGSVTPKKPAMSNSLEGINAETVVRHPAFADIPLTQWFTPEEIAQGIGKMEGDELKISKITGEDVRVKLEPQFPSFVAGLTTIVYDQASNTLHPIITAGRKGAPGSIAGAPFSLRDLLPGGKIPQSLLMDFIAIAKQIAKRHGCEIHADIYWTGERYLLDFPNQVIHPVWVQPGTSVALQIAYRKVGEVHSHHSMAAVPSDLDDASERSFMLYFIVGRIYQLFPDVYARTCWNDKHIKIDPTMLFMDDYVPSDLSAYDLSGVETYLDERVGNRKKLESEFK